MLNIVGMFDVFISYSRADSYIADEIYKGLIGKGLNVFYDKESIRTESFPSKIAQGIKESKIVLFLASATSVASNYAPDELVYAKNNKPRNSIIVYKIDSCSFPDDIELLFASLNQRTASSDSIEVLFDDILELLAQGEISRVPRVSKSSSIDKQFQMMLEDFRNQNFYLVIHKELENGFWKENWNHHLLLMKTYEIVGDRQNYGILLNMYQNSGIVYYPIFYGVISQVWDMLKLGYVTEAKSHLQKLRENSKSRTDVICSNVNYTHILLLNGYHQDALNNYKEILRKLDCQERYSLLLKDFDTLRWIGYNQLNDGVFSKICSNLGYDGRKFVTSLEGHLKCTEYEKLLCSNKWHWREHRIRIVLSFRNFNGSGNTMYNFIEYDKNFLGKVFDVLPHGLDESNTILNSGKAFCQYRLSVINGHLIIEEYNPINEDVSCGEIIYLNKKELHIRIIENGNEQQKGRIRKYKAVES
mgnify:CR=1 FL=1